MHIGAWGRGGSDALVDLALGELACGADDTPDDGRGSEHLGGRALIHRTSQSEPGFREKTRQDLR